MRTQNKYFRIIGKIYDWRDLFQVCSRGKLAQGNTIQADQLDKENQLTLLQRMAYLLIRAEANKPASIRLTSLSGMGSEIWKSTDDIDHYIDGERQR